MLPKVALPLHEMLEHCSEFIGASQFPDERIVLRFVSTQIIPFTSNRMWN